MKNCPANVKFEHVQKIILCFVLMWNCRLQTDALSDFNKTLIVNGQIIELDSLRYFEQSVLYHYYTHTHTNTFYCLKAWTRWVNVKDQSPHLVYPNICINQRTWENLESIGHWKCNKVMKKEKKQCCSRQFNLTQLHYLVFFQKHSKTLSLKSLNY